MSACGVPLAPAPAKPSQAPTQSAKLTWMHVGLGSATGAVVFPPATLACSASDHSVFANAEFGVDKIQIAVRALESGSRLTFVPNATAGFSTNVTLSVSGPFFPATYYAGPVAAGPGDEIIDGAGTLRVSPGGSSGQFDLTLQAQEGTSSVTAQGSWNCDNPRSSPTGVTPPVRLPALAPAQVPPEGGECASTLQHSPSGAVSPLTCGTAVNVLAWSWLYQYDAPAQSLGRAATLTQVERSFCTGTQLSVPVALDIYQIAAAYFGWHFSASAQTVVAGTGC